MTSSAIGAKSAGLTPVTTSFAVQMYKQMDSIRRLGPIKVSSLPFSPKEIALRKQWIEKAVSVKVLSPEMLSTVSAQDEQEEETMLLNHLVKQGRAACEEGFHRACYLLVASSLSCLECGPFAPPLLGTLNFEGLCEPDCKTHNLRSARRYVAALDILNKLDSANLSATGKK